MSIPSKITTELAFLQSQVTAATPLNNASFATIKAIQLNAGNLVADIQTTLTTSSTLDTFAPPVDPISMINGFQLVVVAGQDQNKLSLLRGVAGRVASNLNQLV